MRAKAGWHEHIRLAYWVANRVARSLPTDRRHNLKDDLDQEAVIALERAWKLWDEHHESGAKFSTYAAEAIRGRLWRFLDLESSFFTPYMVWYRGKMKHQPKRESLEWAQESIGVSYSPAPGMMEHRARRLHPTFLREEHLHTEDDPSLASERRSADELLRKVVATLTPREVRVMDGRYWGDLTLEEIGKTETKYVVDGISRERVRQIEMKALRKMRHPSRGRRLKHLASIFDERCVRCRGCDWVTNEPWFDFCPSCRAVVEKEEKRVHEKSRPPREPVQLKLPMYIAPHVIHRYVNRKLQVIEMIDYGHGHVAFRLVSEAA